MTFQRIIIGLVFLSLTQCGVDQRAVPELERDLTRTKGQQGVLLDLAEMALESHAEIDRFETDVLGKMPFLRAIEVYASLTDGMRAGTPRADALLLSRFSIFILDGLRQVSDQETLSLIHI